MYKRQVEGLRSIPAMDRLLGAGQGRVVLITLIIILSLIHIAAVGMMMLHP